MRVGVGLPGGMPGSADELMLEWARRADRGPFATLAVLDRNAGDNGVFAHMTDLARATTRVRLLLNTSGGPGPGTGLLAEQAAGLDARTGGRFTLGLAMARREDEADQLLELREGWEAADSDPRPGGDPLLLLRAAPSDRSFALMARYADGYIHAGGPPKAFARAAVKARSAWVDAGRPGKPEIRGQGYFTLTDPEAGAAWVRQNFGYTDAAKERVVEGLLTTPQAIVRYVRAYEEAGCDEIDLYPAVASIEEIERLAGVVSGL